MSGNQHGDALSKNYKNLKIFTENRDMILDKNGRIIYDFSGFLKGLYKETKRGQYEKINDPCMKSKKLQQGH